MKMLQYLSLLLTGFGITFGLKMPVTWAQLSSGLATMEVAAMVVADVAQEPQDLIEQGRRLYQQQHWSEAIATWQTALAQPSIQANNLSQANLWTYLAMAHHKLGNWSVAEEAIATSEQLLQQQSEPATIAYWHVLAQTLNTKAQLEFGQGQPQAALMHWQEVTRIYRDLNYPTGITGSLLNQARALEVNGYYRRACQIVLEAMVTERPTADLSDYQSCDFTDAAAGEVMERLLQEDNQDLQLLGWRSLGNVLRLTGQLEEAESFLQRGLLVTKEMSSNLPGHHAPLFMLSLAQVEGDRYEQAMFRYQQGDSVTERENALALARRALQYYGEIEVMAQRRSATSIATTTFGDDSLLAFQVQVQRLSLLAQVYSDLYGQNDFRIAEEFQQQLQAQLQVVLNRPVDGLPPSRAAIYSQINLVQSLIALERSTNLGGIPTLEAMEQRLTRVYQQATLLQDADAEAYVLGMLGSVYEYRARQSDSAEHWQEAQRLTTAALSLATSHQADHIAYRWHWQLGRIYKELNANQTALVHYQAAAQTLQTVRQDLLAIDSDVQFSFRDDVEPLYREWVSLLVKSSPSQENLQQAIAAIDALRLSELENFLSCNLTATVSLDEPQADPNAVVLYPIILPDELVVIMRSPHTETLQFHRVKVAATEVEQTLAQLRRELELRYTSASLFALSQQVYDWLIRPFEASLATDEIETLVFVADGGLRNIPMAALHDGEQFLLETYAIALSPGLQLPRSEPLGQASLSTLAFGLSQIRDNFPSHQGFAPLAHVEPEIAAIQTQVSHRTRLNQHFTYEALQDLVNTIPFPIVHLATHGQFSSDPTQTFLLAWDQNITIDDLSQILQTREEANLGAIELLILSACKTADGDVRATLGLAGIAIQAGVRSTIASLWYVDDLSTSELMQNLYERLAEANTPISRAEALRQAQLQLLQTPGYQAPIYWAPYVLVGNWS